MNRSGIFAHQPKAAYILSAPVAALSAAAALGGLLIEDLYHDRWFTEATWLGSDLVTLSIAIPVLVVALVGAARGSARAQLVWLGSLGYAAYNYAFFLFGSALNDFFLLYAGIVACSTLALIFSLSAIDTEAIDRGFASFARVRLAAGFLLFVAAGLAAVEVSQLVLFALNGTVPDVVANTGHPTHVVAALDLTLAIPFLVVAGVLLWRRRPWGFVAAVAVAVKGTLYMANLTAATIAVAADGFDGATAQIPIWGAIGIGSLIVAAGLLVRFNESRPPDELSGTPAYRTAA